MFTFPNNNNSRLETMICIVSKPFVYESNYIDFDKKRFCSNDTLTYLLWWDDPVTIT